MYVVVVVDYCRYVFVVYGFVVVWCYEVINVFFDDDVIVGDVFEVVVK